MTSVYRAVTDRGGAGVFTRRGTSDSHERLSTERRRHQARNVEVGRLRFRCLLQLRPTDGTIRHLIIMIITTTTTTTIIIIIIIIIIIFLTLGRYIPEGV